MAITIVMTILLTARSMGLEHYMFSTGCRYFFKIAGNLFESRPYVSHTYGRRPGNKKAREGLF